MAVQRVYIVNQKPNHLLHLFLAIITCGAWLLPWILVTFAYRVRQVLGFFRSR